jgi:hypothetical protein
MPTMPFWYISTIATILGTTSLKAGHFGGFSVFLDFSRVTERGLARDGLYD